MLGNAKTEKAAASEKLERATERVSPFGHALIVLVLNYIVSEGFLYGTRCCAAHLAHISLVEVVFIVRVRRVQDSC